MPEVLCSNPHCGLPGQHLPERPDCTCRGCLPALARDGLRLCDYCTRRIGQDAIRGAELHDDLGEVLIHRAGNGLGGTAVGAPAPDGDVMELRHTARTVLARLAGRVVRERGITGPWAWALDRLPPGVYGPANRVRRPVDDPASNAAFVAKHAEWLAAQPDADEIAADLRAVVTDRRVYALAYPGRSARLYLGTCPLEVSQYDPDADTVQTVICGERLYHYPDEQHILCGGCSTQETVEQWQTWLVPKAAAEVDAYALAADLALKWGRPVDPSLIRQWAARGKIEPVWEPNPDHPAGRCPTCPHPGDGPAATCPRWRRPRRVNRRVMYPLAAARAYARSLWAPRAVPPPDGGPDATVHDLPRERCAA